MTSLITWTENIWRQIKNQPSKIALLDLLNQRSYSYHDLGEIAQKQIKQWQELGARPGHHVVLSQGKSVSFVCDLLACDAMGLVWTPAPPSIPEQRRQKWVEAIDPFLCTDEKKTVVFGGEMRSQSDARYLIFTSGSSGEPKGVLMPWMDVPKVLDEQRAFFDVTNKTVSLWMLSPAFDASISDLGVVLGGGGTMLIDPNDQWRRPKHFALLCESHKISYVDAPPSWMRVVRDIPSSLTTVVEGGEVLDDETAKRWARKVRVINVYGPTETTICSSMDEINDHRPYNSIGYPLSHVDYKIEQDELLIKTSGSLLGYWKNQELTSERKRDGWFFTRDQVSKMQRTNSDRFFYIYHGRLDRQTKIRGQLINLDEIDCVWGQLGFKSHSWVTQNQLVSVVFDERAEGAAVNWKEKMAAHLPSWGVPNKVAFTKNWPIGATGKTNCYEIEKRNWEWGYA